MKLYTETKCNEKYSKKGYFSTCIYDRINTIINTLSDDDFKCSDENHWVYSEQVEARRTNLLNNLDKIINPDPNWEFHEDLEYQLNELAENRQRPTTREYVYESLKELIEVSDSRIEYVRFAWF